MKKHKRKEKFDFSLHTVENRKWQLIVYLSTVFFVFIIYLLTIIFFNDSPALIFVAFISFLIGLAMIFYRDKIVNRISQKMLQFKIKNTKKQNKQNLKNTIRKINPSHRNLKLKIGGSLTIKDKIDKIVSKFKKTDKKQKDYIEYKD